MTFCFLGRETEQRTEPPSEWARADPENDLAWGPGWCGGRGLIRPPQVRLPTRGLSRAFGLSTISSSCEHGHKTLNLSNGGFLTCEMGLILALNVGLVED